MRRTKTDIMSGFGHSEKVGKSRFIAGNTVGVTLMDDTYIVRLHDTNIVTTTNDVVTLDSGGWQTPTTKDRMNAYLYEYDVRVTQDQKVWYVRIDGERYQFYDGIRINLGTKQIVSVIQRDRSEEIQALRWHIAKYAKLIDKLDEFPVPSASDCWDCSFKTKEGVTMGDLGGRTTMDVTDIIHVHLMSHMTERYLHGSIVVNAWMEKHGNEQTIGLMMQSPRQFEGLKESIRRYLRGYMMDRLIPLIQNGNHYALEWLREIESKRVRRKRK